MIRQNLHLWLVLPFLASGSFPNLFFHPSYIMFSQFPHENLCDILQKLF